MDDSLLITLSFICVIVGMIGSVLPALPGSPLAWVGLLIFKYTDACTLPWWVIILAGIVTLIVAILDYIIPAYGTKKFGGTKWGMWGSVIGLFIGAIFFPPFGILIGPFVGAFIFELIHNYKDKKRAFKAAVGSFIGFIFGVGMKLTLCMIFLGILTYQTISYFGN